MKSLYRSILDTDQEVIDNTGALNVIEDICAVLTRFILKIKFHSMYKVPYPTATQKQTGLDFYTLSYKLDYSQAFSSFDNITEDLEDVQKKSRINIELRVLNDINSIRMIIPQLNLEFYLSISTRSRSASMWFISSKPIIETIKTILEK